MDERYKHYLLYINPKLTLDDIEEARPINQYEIFFRFKDGDKCIFDRTTNMIRGFYPEDHELSDDEWKRSFKNRLCTIMMHECLTQEELADRVGTSQIMISRYMTGACVPSAVMLKKIAKALNTSMDDFFYQEY